MNFRNAGVAILLVLASTLGVFAQETLDSGDLFDKVQSLLDLKFSQEDQIKPLVEKYVSGINQIESQGETNEKALRPQIIQLNQQFDQKMSEVLTPDQLNVWKTAKKQVLLNAGEPEKGENEANEAGEANERNERRGKY